jgi:hypothetical protein
VPNLKGQCHQKGRISQPFVWFIEEIEPPQGTFSWTKRSAKMENLTPLKSTVAFSVKQKIFKIPNCPM